MTFWEVFGVVFMVGLGFFGYEYLVFRITQWIMDWNETIGWMLWAIAGLVIPVSLFITAIIYRTGFGT